MFFKKYIVLIILLTTLIASAEDFLQKDILDIIDQSVFEVVIKKPKNDSLTYEKELPLHLLPFSVRNDDYYSIGTAFAVEGNRFLSAAHVFSLETASQYEEFFIRDKNKNVYSIDKVFKYANNKDFILFSVKDIAIGKTLPIKHDVTMNEAVYAVGNAFGEGIIIRNGVLTSKTPEEEAGAWEYYRFSAAASPGNSGGPLLDKKGNIIGVITMKSPNENLNYALPIKVVNDFKKEQAVYHNRINYNLLNTKKTKLTTFDFQIDLPRSYYDLKKEAVNSFTKLCEGALSDLLSENEESFFPNGKSSLKLLHSQYTAIFPNLISEGEDGNWGIYYPKDIKKADLDKNGFVKYGTLGDILFIYLQKPDNVPLKDVFSDSKRFMDILLEALPFTRPVASERIRIKSFGKAVEEYTLKDIYNRTWLVRNWLHEYNDNKIVTFSMPVPGGAITMLQIGQTGFVDCSLIPDLKALMNFVYLSYYGTFSQWEELLGLKKYLPDNFSRIDFSYKAGNQMTLKTDKLAVSYTRDLFNITDNSDMKINYTFYKNNGQITWDIGRIVIGEDKLNNNYFVVNKDIKPVEGLPASFVNDWKEVLKQKYPFDGNPQYIEGKSQIQRVHDKYSDFKKAEDTDKPDVLYLLKLALEGKIPGYKLKKKFKDLNEQVIIKE